MGYVLKAVLSSAQHPEYGQITVPFPIPDEKYDRMIELLEPLEIGDALRQDCRVDELDSFYTVLNRLVGSLVNFDELDYLAKRLDSFDDGEAAQFQGMACKLGVSNIKDFINLTFCCQQATVITDFSDLDAIGRQHYMTMQGGGCRIEELERLDGRKFALDLILNHLEGRITPYGVVYDNGMKLEQLYDGRHFPCYHYQPNLLAVGLSSRQEPENTDQITWLLLPCSEQQLQRGIARSGVNIHDARIWYEDSLLPSEVEEVLEGQREDLFALNDMATAIAALSDLEQKKLTAVMEMAKPECAGEIRELAKNLELFEFAPKVRTPAEYGRYMIQDSGHYEYDPNLEEFYDYERYGKLRMEKETGAFTEKGYVAYVSGELFEQYIHDMKIVQHFAMLNRQAMMDEIVKGMKLHVEEQFTTIHNYIDTDAMILRKGAVSAKEGERLLIPINMRDGSLLCVGKGNEDWNCSAPHGAGRLMSRADAKQSFTVSEFKKQMAEVYTTSVSKATLDEYPMAYKGMQDILDNIGPTADVVKIIRPIYNFKAGDED